MNKSPYCDCSSQPTHWSETRSYSGVACSDGCKITQSVVLHITGVPRVQRLPGHSVGVAMHTQSSAITGWGTWWAQPRAIHRVNFDPGFETAQLAPHMIYQGTEKFTRARAHMGPGVATPLLHTQQDCSSLPPTTLDFHPAHQVMTKLHRETNLLLSNL